MGGEGATASSANADDGLDELRCGEAEEWAVRFTGDGAREQRLACARRSHQQDAVGDLRPEALILFRRLEEIDDFGQVLLGFLDPGHVVKRDTCPRVAGIERGLALAEGP